MSTRGHHPFIDNLISSVTDEKQNNNNVIRPALVPDIVPVSFSFSENLNLGKQKILPRYSGEGEYEEDSSNTSAYYSGYSEFSPNNQDHAFDGSDNDKRMIETKTTTAITGNNDIGFSKKGEAKNTALSSASSNKEIKEHNETVEEDDDLKALSQINDYPSTVKKNDNDDDYFKVENNREGTHAKRSLFLSSADDLETKHSKQTMKDIEKKRDSIKNEIIENDINDTFGNRNHLVGQNKNNGVTKVSRVYANYDDLKDKKDKSSKENDGGANPNVLSNVDHSLYKQAPKIIKKSLANPDSGKEGAYAHSGLHSTTEDNRQKRNHGNEIKVRSTFRIEEKGFNNIDKVTDKDHFYQDLSDPGTSNTKASSASHSSFSKHEEPTITVHIGRIEVRAASTLQSQEGNDYCYPQSQPQSTPPPNYFQRLSLSDYLKQRAEGKKF